MKERPKARNGARLSLFGVAIASALAVGAITQAEWEADHSLIPTPSATSAFYVVSPTPYGGAQSADAVLSGYDTTPAERIYDFRFGTDLKTYNIGSMLIVR